MTDVSVSVCQTLAELARKHPAVAAQVFAHQVPPPL